jgi:DNA-binding transcriptional LysR family regulator
MDLHYLKIFYEVANEGSFTKAANKLYINQSAVSIQIKKFEELLNTKLFDRSSKKIKLTYSGEVLYKIAEEIFQKVKRAEKEIERIVVYDKAKIVIGSTHLIGEQILPRILKKFSENYPEIEFDLIIKDRTPLIKDLKEGKVDVALMGTYYIKDKELEVIEIANYPFVIIYNEDINDPTELAEKKLIMRNDSPLTRKNIANFEKKYKVSLDEKILVQGSIETIKNLVKEGFGYTVLPYYSVYLEIEKGEFKVIEEFDNDDGYQLVVTKDKYEKKEIQKFIAQLKNFRI